ncbi:MAG: hypothetical protein A2744_04565 [Candidatus Buchananbacteria bacterium RIFCSPHIGHO2_01_FULL_44_11]|uniref:Tyrosine recombinase XerC n=1 Tax=Candidatus Buchananbacteria bacterium RIFCSPHIGHO2_01_FULL_44_11 TaxID=1797535 RepID=A0A1G1Y3U8_9BACT|nr:MAG: hypothetical protein A2744_04565 [Candidatus Buchananbacteria bacterium RIFCSPHIGHO2_01_FULL_44_11]
MKLLAITPLIEKFLSHLKNQDHLSLATIKNYDFYLKRFLLASKITNLSQLDDKLINQYRLWLDKQANRFGRTLAGSTKNYHLIALRSFLKYWQNQTSLKAEQIKLARLPNRKISRLENSELERLLESPLRIKQPKIIQWRDKAMLELLFASGLRVSELANLRTQEVRLERDDFVVLGKKQKPRKVFISNQAKFWLKKYLAERKDQSPFLFIRHDRATRPGKIKAITARSIQRLIQAYARAVGIKNPVNPRIIRHTIASYLIKEGTDLQQVKNLLGHSSILTTRKYR